LKISQDIHNSGIQNGGKGKGKALIIGMKISIGKFMYFRWKIHKLPNTILVLELYCFKQKCPTNLVYKSNYSLNK